MCSDFEESGNFDATPSRVLFASNATFLSDAAADAIIDRLLLCNAATPTEPVILVISSDGGRITLMSKIVDIINAISCPVITQVIGSAASAAAFLATCGAPKGQRWISETSSMMLHKPALTHLEGNVHDVEVCSAELSRISSELLAALSSATGKRVTTLRKDLVHDKWFSAKAAVSYGLVDQIGICPELLGAYTSIVRFALDEVEEEAPKPRYRRPRKVRS